MGNIKKQLQKEGKWRKLQQLAQGQPIENTEKQNVSAQVAITRQTNPNNLNSNTKNSSPITQYENNVWDRVKWRADKLLKDTQNIASNFALGVKKAGESSLSYIESMSNKSSNYKRYNQFNARLNKEKEQLNNLKNGKNIEGKEVNKQITLPSFNDFKLQSQEQTASPILSKTKENSKLESPINQYLNEKITADEEKIQQNIENSSNRVSKKIAELMPGIAQSVTGMGISVVNPGLGAAFWQTSAGGDYIKDAKNRGMTDEDALLYGTMMGSMESATEWIGGELTKGVAKAVAKDGVVKGLKALGLDIGENFFEEAIMEPLQETVASMTGGKETADWSNMTKRMLQSGVDGALTSILMGGASAGVGKATSLIGKMQNGEKITQQEIADVLKEINKQEELDIERILVNSFGFGAQDLYKNTTVQEQVDNKLNDIAGQISQDEVKNIIDNSNLPEEQKASLKRVAEKHNMSTKEVQNLINNPPQEKLQKSAEKQGTELANNEVLKNNQQVSQTDNKTVQNGNIEQIEQNESNQENMLVNNQKTLYNNNESEVDFNEIGQTTKQNDGRGEEGILEEQRGQNYDERNQSINQAESKQTKSRQEIIKEDIDYANKKENQIKNLSKIQQQIKNKYEKQGVKVVFYDKDSKHGGYYNENTLYINQNGVTENEQLIEAQHENAHRLLRTPEINEKVTTIAEKIIQNDVYGDTEIIRNYIMEHAPTITTEDLDTIYKNIVEEILADYAVDIENGVDFSKDNKYEVDENILNEYKDIIKNYLPTDENSSFSMQEKNIDKYNKYKQNIIKKNEETINNLISYKNDSVRSIENSIREKEALLNSKRNKETKVANTIKMQIENLKTRKIEIENIYNEKIDKFNSKIDKKKLEIEVQKQMKKDVKKALSLEIKPLLEGSETWKDKNKGIWYSRETAQRNIYDIVPNKEQADLINRTIFDPIQEHQANKTREINELFQKINNLNLDKNQKYTYTENENGKMIKVPSKNATTYKVDEATLAQLYIEKKITEEDLENYGVNVDKIKNTAQAFTEILDSLYNQMNETVVKYGYSPIGKIENYFPHFMENKPDTIIGKAASLFGIDTTNQELPTEIAGRTENFKPGKTWNSNLLQRKSDKTDYDALKALEKYIVGAEDIIHTTEDIQRLRQFGTELRYRYSEKGIQERIDEITNNEELMPFEQEEAIENILSNKNNQLHQLSHFATWLDDYTNVLANKKNSGDREFEKNFSRNMYTTMSSIEGRIAANTIGGNLSVSLTNIAPLAQAFGTTKSSNMIIGMLETTINDLSSFVGKKDTSFVTNSDFLTNRFGTDRISKKKISENMSDVLSTPMNAIDEFTAESIVRAKYRENLQEGMSEEEALKSADKYAKNLMADRSKGALPVIFNNKNPISKLVTMFQVEPNNMVSNYLKDMPREAKNKRALTWSAAKLMASSYAFNTLIMAIRGGNEVLPDPIRFVTYLTKWLFSDDEEEKEQAQSDMLEAVVGATPFVSNVAGLFGLEDVGRIPVSNAMPDIVNMGTLFDDDVSDEYKKEMLVKEISKPLLYLGLPVGGAQLSKTIQGLATIKAGGSYKTNKEGERQLQFPVERNIGNTIKAGIFGKYSLPSANQYIDSGFKSLNAEATKLYDETGIDYNILSDYINYSGDATIKDDNGYTKYTDKDNNIYWYDKETQSLYNSNYEKSSNNIKNLEKSSKKEMLIEYVNNLNISDKEKMSLYKYNIISSTVTDDGTSGLTDMEHMIKNGMTEKKFMENYTKAIENNISFPDAEDYDKIKKVGLKVDKYLDYKIEVKEKTDEKRLSTKKENADLSDTEKMEILQSSTYSTKEREALYSNYIMKKSDDKPTEYENLKEYYANNSALGAQNKRAYEIIDQYIDYKVNADNKIKELRANGTKKENESLTEVEKIQLLKDSGYNNVQTEALYSTVIASEKNHKIYEELKKLNGRNSIQSYMTFMLSDRESVKEDDGTLSGKSISGSKLHKVQNTLKGMGQLNTISKIYLEATQASIKKYAPRDYTVLKNYLNNVSEAEQTIIMETIQGTTKMKNGKYKY